jgi:flagellar hook-associated protein 3 FlgL
MAIGRVTQRMLANQVLRNINRNTNALSIFQEQLSSGKSFSKTSDNPLRFQAALEFRTRLSGERRILENIDRADTNLSMTESELRNMTTLIQRTQELAVSGASGTLEETSLRSIASEVREIFQEAIQLANRKSSNGYLFAGDETQTMPFVEVDEGGKHYVVYRGDFGARNVEIGRGAEMDSTVNGMEAFFAERYSATATFSVSDTTAALAGELAGSFPTDTSGDFTINGTTFTVDLATDSLENLRDRINLARVDVVAEIDDGGRLILSSNRSIDYEAANGTSNILQSLGLFERIEGGALGAGITAATTLAALGITPEGIAITVNGSTVHLDLSGAATVGDVISAINGAGLPITASINPGGDGLTILADENVAEFSISNDRVIRGNTLGAITESTTLAAAGITPPSLTAIEIDNGGTSYLVDLSSAATVGDVLDAVNHSGAGVTAEINAAGDGIDVVSNLEPSELGTLAVNEAGAGTSGTQLGILKSVSGNTATGLGIAAEASSLRTEGNCIFDDLIRMLETLSSPESAQSGMGGIIEALSTTLDGNLDTVATIGGRANRLEMARDRAEQSELFLIDLISKNEDVDIAEVATQISMQEAILQASLNAASRVVQPTLLDFLAL